MIKYCWQKVRVGDTVYFKDYPGVKSGVVKEKAANGFVILEDGGVLACLDIETIKRGNEYYHY